MKPISPARNKIGLCYVCGKSTKLPKSRMMDVDSIANGLAHELWAMSQGPAAVDDVVPQIVAELLVFAEAAVSERAAAALAEALAFQAIVMSYEDRIARLELAAAHHMSAAAVLHGSPHDIVAIRKYGESRAKLRDILPSDEDA